MSMATVLPSPSIPRFPSKSLNKIKPNSFLIYRTRIRPYPARLDFAAAAAAEKTGVCFRRRTMGRANVSRDSGDVEEGVAALEQEALIDGPSGFRRLESTLNRLSKWAVAGTFGGVILWRHDAEAMWFVTGSILNSILSVALKRVFNQERPVAGLRSDPGMPSSHAQSILFIAVFSIISVLEMVKVKETSFILSLLILGFAAYISWLRVSQRLHTLSQVLVGALFGSVFCILWYFTWHSVVQQAFVSSLWVRILVILGAAVGSLGFLLYAIRNWLRDER